MDHTTLKKHPMKTNRTPRAKKAMPPHAAPQEESWHEAGSPGFAATPPARDHSGFSKNGWGTTSRFVGWTSAAGWGKL